MKAIKTQYQSMNKGFNLNQSAFNLKTEEYRKLKEENDLLTLDKRRMIAEIKTLSILKQRTMNDFE